MHIGILQTGHAPEALQPEHGLYSDLFETLLAGRGFDFTTWNVVDMEFPESATAADGWLVTGSRHGAYEDLPFIPPLEDFLRKAYEAQIPIVGICFGHQILAQALGGRVEKFAGGWAVGRQVYDWGGEPVALNAWHQDQVVEKPQQAERIATHPFCENAALLYGDRAFTVQAHPEFAAPYIEGLITHRGDKVPDDLLTKARHGLTEPVENARLADSISRFFTERRI
ncbi:type 1 glutamine amidotransferase [Histidinibacterium aquaticum]|uniref:Type 1 glutamine amidotransferase n=1 Tax=Histidinibacterium aquaticum TaxID=2613962 RepID=A0A5J5GQ46_9RHOB|nr:type 1 glutamine amidotransferase [Histidinibacterium aquaticum]KAA9009883.1 type 1 glutamine amidotransferase [Histidinibacterium aquaticum]